LLRCHPERSEGSYLGVVRCAKDPSGVALRMTKSGAALRMTKRRALLRCHPERSEGSNPGVVRCAKDPSGVALKDDKDGRCPQDDKGGAVAHSPAFVGTAPFASPPKMFDSTISQRLLKRQDIVIIFAYSYIVVL
jgi:hypothetical protein